MSTFPPTGTGAPWIIRYITPKRISGNRPGFSLMEALITVSLLSMLTVFGSLSFQHAAPRIRLHNATWEVNARLNWVRYKAIYSGKKIKMVFEPDRYTVFAFDPAQNSWHPIQAHILEGVVVSANNSPIFHPGGTVSNLATILIRNSSGGYKITLAISGRIKLMKISPD